LACELSTAVAIRKRELETTRPQAHISRLYETGLRYYPLAWMTKRFAAVICRRQGSTVPGVRNWTAEPRGKRVSSGRRCPMSHVLEADLQDLTSIAHEPSSFWCRKSDRPVAAHSGKSKPGLSFIGSPG